MTSNDENDESELLEESTTGGNAEGEGRRYEIQPVDALQLVEGLNRVVIGQSAAKEQLSHAVAMHIWRARSIALDRVPNVLIAGPSGCGKTLTASALADYCGVPFVDVEATALVPAGIVGFKVEHIAELLVEDATRILESYQGSVTDDEVLALAERGIVFLDEFDKLASASEADRKDSSLQQRVQRRLLKFVEGDDVQIGESQTFFARRAKNSLSTRRLLVIAAGAFSGIDRLSHLRTNNEMYKRMFGRTDIVVAEDIINFGIMPELVGRLELIVEFDALSVDELLRVLENDQSSPLPSLLAYGRACSVDISISSQALRIIAERSRGLQTGARGLQQLLFPLVTTRVSRAVSDGVDQVSIDEKDFVVRSDLW